MEFSAFFNLVSGNVRCLSDFYVNKPDFWALSQNLCLPLSFHSSYTHLWDVCYEPGIGLVIGETEVSTTHFLQGANEGKQ